MLSFLRILTYPVYYYILGTFAILEDIIFRFKNICELEERTGDVAVITGGSRGIGAEVVKKLLQCDMHVIIGCRNVMSAVGVVDQLRAEGVTSGSTSVHLLDMGSFDCIKDFATIVLNSQPKINLLINNAGIMFPPYTETIDGFESQWQINYLGHFLLSHLLLPRMEATASDEYARIVNVSSCASFAAYPFDFLDINRKDDFITQAAYAQSKLAQLMFTLYLEKKLRILNANVDVVAVHPGIVNTDLFDNTLMKKLFPWVPSLLFKTAEEGATTVMFAVLKANGGEYISNGGPASTSDLANDRVTQEQLFIFSKNCTDITSFGGLDL